LKPRLNAVGDETHLHGFPFLQPHFSKGKTLSLTGGTDILVCSWPADRNVYAP
jgi:hypothetical protein